jgi:hypothetical protein
MDVHDGQHKDEAAKRAMAPPKGDFYEIPYGCLVPLEVDSLLVAGRCISSTRWANGAMRIQPTCMNTGQAAGLAAARCAREGQSARSLSGTALREELVRQGMEL